jgi:galactoside O-acetyltransferase
MIKIRSLIRRITGATPLATENWDRYKLYLEIDPTAIISPSASIVISHLPEIPRIMVRIGANSHIAANIALTTQNASVNIGSECQIGASNIIAASEITIGNSVIISWGCTFLDSNNHALNWEGRKNDVLNGIESYKLTNGKSISILHDWTSAQTEPIFIGSRSYIGMNVSILKGVKVGDEAVIGAASVIRRDVPPKSISIGNPSVIIGYTH